MRKWLSAGSRLRRCASFAVQYWGQAQRRVLKEHATADFVRLDTLVRSVTVPWVVRFARRYGIANCQPGCPHCAAENRRLLREYPRHD